MSNKRITDLPNSTRLIGTEALILDQESDIAVTGIDTVQTTLSSIQEFTLSAAPFLTVTGNATVSGSSNFIGNVSLPGASATSTNFKIDNELTVGGDAEFLEDVIIRKDLLANDIFLAAAGDANILDIFAFKGQYIQNGGGVEFIQRLTQAQYDAIGIPDPLVLYIIVG
jgi:hypothetical protein